METFRPEERPRIIALSADTVQVRGAGGGVGGQSGDRGTAGTGHVSPLGRACAGCSVLLAPARLAAACLPASCVPAVCACAQTLHDRCLEAGIEQFITKPFRVEDLRRVMKTCNRLPPRFGSTTVLAA